MNDYHLELLHEEQQLDESIYRAKMLEAMEQWELSENERGNRFIHQDGQVVKGYVNYQP